MCSVLSTRTQEYASFAGPKICLIKYKGFLNISIMLLINDQNEIHIDIQLGGAGMYMNTHTNAHMRTFPVMSVMLKYPLMYCHL